MADTIRQLIMENLVNRFKAISTTTGYSANYPVVDEWRLKALDPEDLPAIVLEDQAEEVTKIVTQIADRSLTLNITIIVDQDTAPEDLRNYIQDVYKCMAADRTCGGYAEDVYPVKDDIELVLEGQVYGAIITTWTVVYMTDAWDPTINMS